MASAENDNSPKGDNSTDKEKSLELFDITRVKKPEYWQFIKLVAPENRSAQSGEKPKWESKDAKEFYCVKCKKSYKFIMGNSSHISRHMQNFHYDAMQSYLKNKKENRLAAKKLKLIDFLPHDNKNDDKKLEKPAAKADQSEANEYLIKWICKNLRPFSVVEDEGLSEYIDYLQRVPGRVLLPDRHKIRLGIETYAARLRESLKKTIASEARYFSLTSDVWTSRATHSYMAVTLHYVTEEFKMRDWTIEVAAIHGKHTGEALRTELSAILDNWKLDQNYLVKLVRDGGSDIKKACELMLRKDQHLSCIAHSLHLVVQGVLRNKNENYHDTSYCETLNDSDIDYEESAYTSADIDRLEDEMEGLQGEILSTGQDCLKYTRVIVHNFRLIAIYFNKCAKGRNFLDKLQDKNNDLRTIIDVPTRWNSTLDMLRRLIRLKSALTKFFSYIYTEKGRNGFSDCKLQPPNLEMWCTVECLVQLLSGFESVTKALSGTKYPTLPLVCPCLRLLKKRLSNESLFTDIVAQYSAEKFTMIVQHKMQTVRKVLLFQLSSRFDTLSVDLLWCSVIDPRCGKLQMLTNSEKALIQQSIIEETVSLVNPGEDNNTDCIVDGADEDTNSNTDISDPFMQELFGEHENFECNSLSAKRDSSREESIIRLRAVTEVKLYLRVIQHTKCVNPLRWWQDHQQQFPMLSRVARKWFGTAATSSSSERAFSTAGNLVTCRRSRIASSMIRDVIFIHNNL